MPDGAAWPDHRHLALVDWPDPLLLLRALLAGDRDTAQTVAQRLDDTGWRSFRDLTVVRHRVAPMAAQALGRLDVRPPAEIASEVAAEARNCGFAALSQRAESLRLAENLGARGIRGVWLKGWPLAEVLYGAPGLRHASDIDILVDPAERVEAARCLVAMGYRPAEDHRARARAIAHPAVEAECKDVGYIHGETGIAVELHWRTNHFRGWPNLAELGEPLDVLPGVLPGAAGPILVPGPLGQLIYLSSHGQQHLFSRLKWLLDIARLAEARGLDLSRADLTRAEATGAGRPVRLALHLAWRVFGCTVPARARDLRAREAAWAEEVLSSIADPNAAPGRMRTRLEFYRWHWRMADGAGQRAGVLRDLAWRRIRLRLVQLSRKKASRGDE